MSYAFRVSAAANIVLAAIVGALLLRGDRLEIGAGARWDSSQRVAKAEASGAGASGNVDAVHGARTAVAELEAIGIPREVVAQALIDDVVRRWDRRIMARRKEYEPKRMPEREALELSRQCDAERERVLKEALGEAGFRAWDKERTLRLLNPTGVPMSAAEAEKAYRLQKEQEEKYRELQMAMEDGLADPADVSLLQAQAQETCEQELEALLGKTRLAEMRGVFDPVADVYRNYGDLHPTPEQARAVADAEKDLRARAAALSRRLDENPAETADLAGELKALDEAREESLRRIFGAEAYENQKRQHDPTYKALAQYAAAWELGADEIAPVYETLRAFHDRAEVTRKAASLKEAAGQTGARHDIESAIEQVRQQTEARLHELIGGPRLWRLKQNGLLDAVRTREARIQ